MHVQEAIGDYLAAIQHLRPLTRKGYAQRLTVFAQWCTVQEPAIELEHIKNTVVYSFLDCLKETHKPHRDAHTTISTHTVAGYVRALLAFLHWCMEDEEYSQYVKLSVIRRIKLPSVERKIVETFTVQELDELFLACDREESADIRLRNRAMLALLIDTGIRADELCTLTIGNTKLKPSDPHIKVLGKGRKEREIPIGERARRIVQSYIRLSRAKAKVEEALFIGRYHQPLTVSGLEQMLDRLKYWAGLQNIRVYPHKFRHTYARMFWLKMNDLLTLSLFLGHEDIQTTMEYLKTLTSTEVRQVHREVSRRMHGLSILDSLELKNF